MKKRVLIPVFVFLLAFTVFACLVLSTPSTILYLLNWGEYIDHDLVEEFETSFHCQVVEENVTSSEAMYQKIASQTTNYDVAIPGDYTVHQLYNEGLLKELDVNNSDYPNLNAYQDEFTSSLSSLISKYMVDDSGKEFNSYFMPYFWGAYSLIYSKNNADVESVIEKNGFSSLYQRNLFQEEVKIGMYDTARWIVSSYLLSLDKDPNLTCLDPLSEEGDISEALSNQISSVLISTGFDEFGNDQLKRDVANSSLDLCYSQSGDFFDVLYLFLSQSDGKKAIDFSINIPETTAAFFDSMIIPTTSKNYELANAFINFMLEPENAYRNARAIGYCPTLKSVCEMFVEKAKQGEMYYEDENIGVSISLGDFLEDYPMYLDPLYASRNVYLLKPKSNSYLTSCETIFNSLA